MDQERVICPYCHPPYKEIKTEFNGDDAYIRRVWLNKFTPLKPINLTTGEMGDVADPPFYELMIVGQWAGDQWQEADGLEIQYCPWCGRKLDDDN